VFNFGHTICCVVGCQEKNYTVGGRAGRQGFPEGEGSGPGLERKNSGVAVETVDTVDKTKTVTCPHRVAAQVVWIVNDNVQPPVIFVMNVGESVITLTNKTIKVNCGLCYQELSSQMLAL